jgi:hypothetical protein
VLPRFAVNVLMNGGREQAMRSVRRILLAGAVFAIALGTGFVMQNGDAIASRSALVNGGAQALIAPSADPVLVDPPATVPEASLPQDPGPARLPGLSPLAARRPAAEAEDLAARLDLLSRLSPFGLPCEAALSVEPAYGAMIALSLSAPCQATMPVTVTQGGLRFTTMTDRTGALRLTLPALSPEATVTLRFDDGSMQHAKVDVPEAADFARVALQWQGETGLSLHAFEFGAERGGPGHVHAGAAHSSQRAALGAGFMTALGAPQVPGAWLAEIYSFPIRGARREGFVDIVVEAEITAATCGREVRAETLQPAHDGPDATVGLTLTVPDCAAVGDFLMLKNLLRTMKVAAR